MINSAFLNSERKIRNGWWILIFLLVLTSMLVPVILFAQKNSMDVSMGTQAIIILLTSLACQTLRQQPLTELLGKFNMAWLKEFVMGGLMGSALMLVPAFLLQMFGWVDLQWNSKNVSSLASSLFLFAGVALAEELLFRGFVFQRLISGLGLEPAQVLIAVFFLLTHLNNPGMSGTESTGLWKPIFAEAPFWLTGGQFGIEASLPGLICIVLMLIALYRMNSTKPTTNE